MQHVSGKRLFILASLAAAVGAVSACDKGSVCEPDALQCSPLKNRIEQCNADGSAVETVAQCPGNTCVEAGGTATCEDGTEPVCTPGTRQCGASLNQIEVCNAGGTAFERESSCEGNTCVVEGDTVRCDDPEPACTAGQTRCDATRPQVVEVCAASGDAWSDKTTCVGALNCVETDGQGANCQTCVPGSTYCGANNASVDVCNSAGTALESGGACANNSCKLRGDTYGCEYPCTPGATRCGLANQTVETCNAAGDTWETTEGCLDNSCTGPDGSAACGVSPDCTPGQTRCSAADPKVVESCNLEGDGWELDETCRGILECVTSESGSGACQQCVPGSTLCNAGNGSFAVCNAAGTALEHGGTCLNSSCKLLGDSYGCEFPCAPGATRCGLANQTVETCNTAGDRWVTSEGCLDNSCTVASGAAVCGVAPSCTPGGTRCRAGDPKVVETCNLRGDGWELDETCPGILECVTSESGSGSCQQCVPGSTLCNAGNGSFAVCNAAGTAMEHGGTCLNSSCKFLGESYGCELPCAPGATKCGLANQTVQTCNAAGTTFVTSQSCLNNSCRGLFGAVACEEVPVCTPGQKRCSAVATQVVETCNTRGDGWTEGQACAGALACITNGSGSGVCQTCIPGATRCGSGNAKVEVCNAGGTAYEAGESCLAGSCKYDAVVAAYACEYPCTPGETRCGTQNQTVQACNQAGDAFVLSERCVANSCTTANGPATCAQPEVCTAGTRRCSTTAPNQVEQCKNDGSGWYTASTCAGVLECGGSGTCQTCVPGALTCGANNASVSQCNAGGTGFTTAQTCTSNSCGLRDGVIACEFPCTPGETRCAFNGARIEVCAAGGTSYTAGESCLNNSCGYSNDVPVCGTTPVCTPGQRRCSATSPGVVEQCRTTADGWYAQSTCGGSLQCTTGSGSAACQTCVPGAARCGANNATTEVCNAAGTAYVTAETCAANSCEIFGLTSVCKYPCAPGSTRCSATKSQVQVCSAAGDVYTLSEACVGNSCTVSGSSAYCGDAYVCTPGTRRCSNTASNQVEQCRPAGDGWSLATTCAGTLQCTVTASGGEGCQVCAPGSRYCGANNGTVMECNQTGTAITAVETCLSNSCTSKNGAIACAFPCTPGTQRCSALRNRVEVCNAAGTGVDTVESCTENSCSEALGSASCAPPIVECVAGETRCSPLGTIVQVCGSSGRFESGQTCASADCRVLNGAASCGEPECAPNVSFCGDDGDVHYCTSNGRDGGVSRDCDAAATCRVLDGAAQCVAPAVPLSCEPGIQFCGDDGAIYYCNSAGQVSGVRTQCGDEEVCVYDANAPMCLAGYYDEGPGGEVTCVVTETAACTIIPRAFTERGFIYAETIKESCDNDSRVTRECGERMECVDGSCTSSVLDTESPWYEYSCPLTQQLAYPTELEADCRCFVNNSVLFGPDVCGRPYDRATRGVTIGTGPRVFGLANGHYSGGFIDGNELIVAAYWGSSTAQRGAVLAVDVNNGNRRLVSGELGGAPVGTGPAFSYALDVRKGVDGNFYAFTQSTLPGAPSIFRVNPTTGARTLVWKGQDPTFGQCAAGDPGAAATGHYVQYTNQGFAIDASGAFLLGYANPIRDGRGLVKISADGATCTYISATGTRADGLTRGTGPALGGFVQGFMVDGNTVLVHTTQPKALIEINLTTGSRTALYSSSTAGNIGERWAVKDTARGVIWTAGLMNSVSIVAYDPVQNKTLGVFSGCGDPNFPWYPLCPGSGPIKINSLNYGGMWIHPTTGNLLFAHDSVSIVEFEPETGNSVIRSL